MEKRPDSPKTLTAVYLIDNNDEVMEQHTLFYRQPAQTWLEALPIGNGRTAAMIFGDPACEHLQINDVTAWSGSPDSADRDPHIAPADAERIITEAREAVWRGEYELADGAVKRLQHRHSQAYAPFADLTFTVEGGVKSASFQRLLDLRNATHTAYSVSAGSTPIRLHTEAFASYPDGVISYHWASSKTATVSGRVTSPLRVTEHVAELTPTTAQVGLLVQLPSDIVPPHDGDSDPVRYDDNPNSALRGAILVDLLTNGTAEIDRGNGLWRVRDATTITLTITTRTTFSHLGSPPAGDAHTCLEICRDRIRAVHALGEDELYRRHLADYAPLYGRTTLSFAPHAPTRAPSSERDTGDRLRAIETSSTPVAHDPAFLALLFHYGRYLLICSSRAGGVPANLQGIWNDSLQPPWSSNYTVNINLQMNYWMVEPANLRECLPPLVELIETLSRTGRRPARDLYGSNGWVCHHNSDIWGYPWPVGNTTHEPKWAFWPMAGVWLVHQIWEHHRYGASERFAQDTLWPLLTGALTFVLDWVTEDPNGVVAFAPSTSPENVFLSPHGTAVSCGNTSTIDLTLARNACRMAIELAPTCAGENDPLVQRAGDLLSRLPDPPIDSSGRVGEWREEHPEVEHDHRHLSHLLAFYPGSFPQTETMRQAVIASLRGRQDESTGWSLAWKLALWARIGDEAKVRDILSLLLRPAGGKDVPFSGGLYPNLFGAHPPFQIDGNLGYVAGMCEVLLQSHGDTIKLLPALPPELADGEVEGLRARPGLEIAMRWGEGELIDVTLRAERATACGDYQLHCHRLVATVEVGLRAERFPFSCFHPASAPSTPAGAPL